MTAEPHGFHGYVGVQRRPGRVVLHEDSEDFLAHLDHLDAAEFTKVVRDKLVPACDVFAADPATPWPASLRMKAVRSAAGVREMT